MRNRSAVLIALVVCLASSAFSQSKPKLTLDEFFNSVYYRDVRLSPDGNSVAFVTERADWGKERFRDDIWLLLNSSVNAYRRLDPHFEAPNQLKASAVDRGAMIRIPIGNERSSRLEVRAVAPDANPYLVMYSVFKTGLDGEIAQIENLRSAERY